MILDAGRATVHLDPLLCEMDLPYTKTCFPLGFRLDIATNSRDVLAAAAQAWGFYRLEFEAQPLEIRVVVQPEGDLARPPVFRLQGHLMSVVSDSGNFAVADLQKLFAVIVVSAKTAADYAWLRWFFLESMGYMLLAQRHVIPMHAACVARNRSGVLLFGRSGAGKSTLSFACARAGWTFVADDCTWLRPDSDDRMVLGKPHQVRFREDSPRLFPELEGFVPKPRPNGKISMEVPTSEFPHIRTASRCSVGSLVFLDRRSDAAPGLEPVPVAEAADLILRDMATYGDEVFARHERGVRRLVEAPAYRLRYHALDDAIRLLHVLNDTSPRP